MTDLLTFSITAFIAIFSIVNPISGVMTFISMTANMSKVDKIYVARHSVIIATLIAIIFSIIGDSILNLFGITVDDLRVAGGILLFLVALDMLFAKTTRESISTEELKYASQRENISVFPIAMPLLTGPGAITTIILYSVTLNQKLIVIGIIFLTFLITFLIFRFSDYFNKVVGMSGMLVMTRLMGLFLGAIAISFIFTGIKNIFNLA